MINPDSIQFPATPGPLGIPFEGLMTTPPLAYDFSLVVELQIVDLPDPQALRVSGDGLVVHTDTVPEHDVALGMTWADTVRWLHTEDLLLGHLIIRDLCSIRGDLLALSAVEGIVSAPRCHPAIKTEVLERVISQAQAPRP